MFHNYVVTALRNFSRHKLYSFINIAGLAVAFASAIFIALFIRDELSYDAWIPGGENVYRLETTFALPAQELGMGRYATAPFPLAAALKEAVPGIRDFARRMPEDVTIAVAGRLFAEQVDFVDRNFFSVIRLPFRGGDPSRALATPNSIVLSEGVARKYFGASDPIGRSVTIRGKYALTVTGVVRDLPYNTQFSRDGIAIFVPNTSRADAVATRDWFEPDYFTYIRLSPSVRTGEVISQAPMIVRRVAPPLPAQWTGNRAWTTDRYIRVRLVPLDKVHLVGPERRETGAGNWTTLYSFAAVAALIIAIGCFNFTNLATVQATMRAREVSLRKVVGARRSQLVVQFVGETVITALIALVIALAIVEVLLPVYGRFLDRPIALHYLADWPLLTGLCALAVAVGAVGGFYPALVLSGFRPSAILHSDGANQVGPSLVRTALVTLQFGISIGLGIVAAVIFAQLHYAQSMDLGFSKDDIVVLEDADHFGAPARDAMVRALENNPAIDGAAATYLEPFQNAMYFARFAVPGRPGSSTLRTMDVGFGFPQIYRMRLLAGRFLSSARAADVHEGDDDHPFESGRNVLVSASAAKLFGYSAADALGKTILAWRTHVTIVGVVDDIKIEGAAKLATPFVYYYDPGQVDTILVRVKHDRIGAGLAAVDNAWRSFAPGVAIKRHFLDDNFNAMFVAAERQEQMLGIFVGIAIFIACLGLFGLAAFSTEQRTREIGVRKVFGARTRDIVRLLLWQFSIPILIANVVAWPVAYYYLHGWLEGYAYRISLSPLYFVAAGAIALVIAWATVIAHALRVARANPVHALRYE